MIKLTNVSKIYKGEGYEVKALDGVNLVVNQGEMVAVMGPSGSGKSTLLNIIGCMDCATDGEYYLGDNAIHTISSGRLHSVRKQNIGFVFQHFALMNNYTAYENIELPLLAANVKRGDRKKRINECMEKLGILELSSKCPTKMSGGQQQRVAIARAIVGGAQVILADEPTGALDQNTGNEVLELLQEVNREGKTVIIVTHDEAIAKRTNRIIRICDGRVVSDEITSVVG